MIYYVIPKKFCLARFYNLSIFEIFCLILQKQIYHNFSEASKHNVNRITVAQMAAHLPHDRKAVGSNPAGSYETRF